MYNDMTACRAVIAANPNCIAFQAKISELEKAK